MHIRFRNNFQAITHKHNHNHFALFAGDHKIEHLNTVPAHHIFEIAAAGYMGALATQPGLIARYAEQYPHINYIAKLNSKTNLAANESPMSSQLYMIDDLLALREHYNIQIRGVGYTVYLGSVDEHIMLKEAAGIITKAHQNGLVAIIWMYPRGGSITQEQDGALIAGAAGVANALGADFVKVKSPASDDEKSDVAWLQTVTKSAGNTRVLISGGAKEDRTQLQDRISQYMHETNIAGFAIGRNIFERDTKNAIEITKSITNIIYKNKQNIQT
jgi:DhnA family fructose-bisphosphate aldolase class Ia